MYRFVTIAFVALILASCSSDQPRLSIKPKQELKVKIDRFDRDFFAMNPDSLFVDIPAVEAKYGSFLTLYTAE